MTDAEIWLVGGIMNVVAVAALFGVLRHRSMINNDPEEAQEGLPDDH